LTLHFNLLVDASPLDHPIVPQRSYFL